MWGNFLNKFLDEKIQVRQDFFENICGRRFLTVGEMCWVTSTLTGKLSVKEWKAESWVTDFCKSGTHSNSVTPLQSVIPGIFLERCLKFLFFQTGKLQSNCCRDSIYCLAKIFDARHGGDVYVGWQTRSGCLCGISGRKNRMFVIEHLPAVHSHINNMAVRFVMKTTVSVWLCHVAQIKFQETMHVMLIW